TMSETADALGIPEGTVKTGLHRARLTLARSLARRRATQLEAV
ncbi:MAG: DNA-directed RNA polymerase specialized sigma24 family protein, partial [Bradymonadia bacterium]